MAATHAGMTTEEFSKIVLDWIATARAPALQPALHRVVYQPMLELLAYLRANGFKTFIVSGGGIEFMRPWAEKVYGIPPEQVVGSSGVVQVRDRADGKPRADEAAPRSSSSTTAPASRSGINRFIGRRPIIAFGNSDGDLQMLQWTAARQRRALHGHRAPHRRRARIRLRPAVAHRQARQGARRRHGARAGPSST